ncbi:hypothetical protein GUJ93_ZPchr0003g18080 [Zizania palustris]|uniref:Uncharacterized protein n=1 Tax=Zizania palustris TaxID=103762 RepID=A0A8J5VDK2_ZIZPA|nr:hypothetical protein GUJ93_ZPchr0003g18080 [Zizania palustris]
MTLARHATSPRCPASWLPCTPRRPHTMLCHVAIDCTVVPMCLLVHAMDKFAEEVAKLMWERGWSWLVGKRVRRKEE